MQIFTQVSTKYIGFAVCAEPPGGGFRLLGISWVYCAIYHHVLSYFALALYLCIIVCFMQFALYLTCLVSYFWCAILRCGLKLGFVCAPFLQRAAAVQCVEGDYSALSAYLWPHTDSLSAAACNHHHHHHHHHPYHKIMIIVITIFIIWSWPCAPKHTSVTYPAMSKCVWGAKVVLQISGYQKFCSLL